MDVSLLSGTKRQPQLPAKERQLLPLQLMTLVSILKNIAAIGTIAIGAYSLIWPCKIKRFRGLDAAGPSGITEIRAVLGGLFIGLGVAVLLLASQPAYQVLGITYLVVAGVRCFSMFVDRSVSQSNLVSAVSELVLGVILMA